MITEDKLISVVIPAYNAENTIIATVNSVYNQTYKNLEIIVVNDGSTDKTLEVITNFKELNNNGMPFIIIDKVNGGVSSARNLGISNSKGEFIAFLDSDDKWLPEKIEKQLTIFIENANIDLLATNRNNENIVKFMGKKFDKLNRISSKTLLFKNFFSPPTVMVRKVVVCDIGMFDENQRYAEEGDLWIRICQNNNCYLLNESLVITGDGKPHFGHSGLSSNLRGMELGELKNIKTAYSLNIINFFEFLFFNTFSLLKYCRRVLIVKLTR